MRRRELLSRAGMEASAFNVLKQRDQLPYDVSECAGWTEYTDEQAKALTLSVGLSRALDIPVAAACRMVRLRYQFCEFMMQKAAEYEEGARGETTTC